MRVIEKFFPHWLWRLPADSKAVALTFDDGPHPETTPALLSVLKDLRIPSTHFVLGSRCRENADLLKTIQASGHVIGNHGFKHISLALQPVSFQRKMIHQANEELFNVLHEYSYLFRPPFGHFNFATKDAITRENHCGVMWSLQVRDWKVQSDRILWERIKNGLHEGAIILMHDAHPTTAAILRILPKLADEVAQRDWRFVVLDRKTVETANQKP